MKAFLTGSRQYGTPGPESDVDLVVLMDELTLKRVAALADEAKMRGGGDYPLNGASLRFGKLNIIAQTTEEQFAAWKVGTYQLTKQGPVTRDRAKEVFTEILKKVGAR